MGRFAGPGPEVPRLALRGAERYDQNRLNARPPPPPSASRVDISAYTRQSRTYDPGDPEIRDKQVLPFQRGELEHYPREVADIYRSLQGMMPEVVFEPGFLHQVRDQIHQYTDMSIDLWLHSVRVMKRTQLRALIPGATLLAVVGMPPMHHKILLEIDLRFAYQAIDRLLGGHGISVDTHRPLTEIEQGVFSYLLLKVMALFQGQMIHPEQTAVRLEDIRSDLKSSADIVRHEDYWLCYSWKLNFDLDVGFIRAFLPTSLARTLGGGDAPMQSALADRIRDRIRSRMHRLAHVQTDVAIEIGRIELTPDDVEALDPGDIILLENTQVQLTEAGVAGPALGTIGLGKRSRLHGQVGAQDGQMVFQLDSIETLDTPMEHDPYMAHGHHRNPEEVIAEYEDPQAYEEANNGKVYSDEIHDEDWGLDSQDAGGGEYDDYGEGGYAEQGEYQEGEYQEQGEYQEGEYQEGEYQEGEEYQEEGGYEEQQHADNLEESQALLGDVPIAVVVEIGRVQLTADEVICLRSGQLLELGRSPNDPIDLVVNGQLLAKGELVEIEGALGVKILSLVKEAEG